MTIDYSPGVFSQTSQEGAKAIILTGEGGLTTDERWEKETEWMRPFLGFREGLIVDYGCGIGRMAKVLDRPVLGVDLAPTMRVMAEYYVQRTNFGAVSPDLFENMVASGLRCSAAMAIWVLQHVIDPARDIEVLRDAVIPGGTLLLVNMVERRVPAVEDGRFKWVHDRFDVDQQVRHWFEETHRQEMPMEICGTGGAHLSLYRRCA